MRKPDLDLIEPNQAIKWLKAFEKGTYLVAKRDIEASPGTSGPPVVAAIAKKYSVPECFCEPKRSRSVDKAQ